MSSPRKDQAQGSDSTEQVGGTHETGQASGSSTPSFESVSDDIDPRIERQARHEFQRDPDYNPCDDEVN